MLIFLIHLQYYLEKSNAFKHSKYNPTILSKNDLSNTLDVNVKISFWSEITWLRAIRLCELLMRYHCMISDYVPTNKILYHNGHA